MPPILTYFFFIHVIKFLFTLPNFGLNYFLLILLGGKMKREAMQSEFLHFLIKNLTTHLHLYLWGQFSLCHDGWYLSSTEAAFLTFPLMSSYLLPLFLVSTMTPSFVEYLPFCSISPTHMWTPWLSFCKQTNKLKPHSNKTCSYCTPFQQNSLKALLLMGTTIFLVFTSVSVCFLLNRDYSYQKI